jgi:hypothetical protein
MVAGYFYVVFSKKSCDSSGPGKNFKIPLDNCNFYCYT